MADSFSLHVFTDAWDEMQAELKVASDRATMYALRATGRAVRAAARGAAPVYRGTDKRAMAESGNLKKSIKSSRNLTRDRRRFLPVDGHADRIDQAGHRREPLRQQRPSSVDDRQAERIR